ncbi:MAG: cytochrome P450 [Acidimicrobiia bacterium]|nr:cytochrome P450 [Acidimicrobiia bacterium]
MLTLEQLAGDPHPHLAALRSRAPVAWVPALDAYLVTGWAAAIEVLRDPATFTVDDPRFSTARVVGPSMLSTDGAEHTRHRDPFAATFRPGLVAERFGAAVDEIVQRCLDDVVTNGSSAELRSALAGPLAAATMMHALGLDAGVDRARLLGWYRAIVESVSVTSAGRPTTAEGASAMSDLDAALRGHVAVGDPSSLLSESMRGVGLDPAEVVSNAAVIMFGGIETTEGMLLNVVWHLLHEPDRFAAVRDHPGLIPAAVEESLRLEPAAAVVDRYAMRDAAVAGTEVAGGAQVTVSLAGANRDPAEFPDPDRFHLNRPRRRRHLAFATGPHVCIGMDLARLEVVSAVTALADRFPRLRLVNGAPGPTGLVFRKPECLPVVWD